MSVSRARNPATFGLTLNALVKPSEEIAMVFTYCEEVLRHRDPQIRAIHIDHIVSPEKTVLHQIPRESYISKVVEVLMNDGRFRGRVRTT
jgi:hypothetical protein